MRKKSSYIIAGSIIAISAGIFLAFSFAKAQSNIGFSNSRGNNQQGGGPGRMNQGTSRGFAAPQEAIDACNSKSENDTCSITPLGASQPISGICKKNPNQSSLVCMLERKDGDGEGKNMIPNERRGGGMMFRRSEEAVAACKDKSEKSECSFTATRPGNNEEETITGTCMKSPGNSENSDSTLACVPERKGEIVSTENQLQRAEKMKTRKSQEITRIENRIEKITSFLKSNNIDTTNIESNFTAFKSKADTFLAKIDAYIAVLKADGSSDDDKRTAFEASRTAGKDMMDYFKNTLRASIKSALDELEK